ncbi:hypothetical protein KEM56_000699 [Ascosphaera pollenicola]|nr:hypothetical protein KEM56_000699 [Ascosphaera pollenicola]
MQYVRSLSGSVSKTWNSINPATLSGAIDVIVIEQEDGTLACSPFHVRFGKFSLFRPSDKKVEFRVNGAKQNYSMKLGEGGEAFFVFQTTDDIPLSMQTSPVLSPTTSPDSDPLVRRDTGSSLQEPEFLDLNKDDLQRPTSSGSASRTSTDKGELSQLVHVDVHSPQRYRQLTETAITDALSTSVDNVSFSYDSSTTYPDNPQLLDRAKSVEALKALLPSSHPHRSATDQCTEPPVLLPSASLVKEPTSISPPSKKALSRAVALSKKLSVSNIPSHITDSGDLMLDMTGYKSNDEDALRAEATARKILAEELEELEGNYDISALMDADEQGNIWIFGSEESKEVANQRGAFAASVRIDDDDAVSDPGYHSDASRGELSSAGLAQRYNAHAQAPPPIVTSASQNAEGMGDPNTNYAKTLRLTSDQLRALYLKPGANEMTFSVNKATCAAYMYLWSYKTPIVISDIDGTITKSDALGHVLNMIGRDWTHLGVAKLYTDIVNNGYQSACYRICAGVHLLQNGIRNFVILERGSGLGGTWRDNTYPGCCCDIFSHLYSYSFAQNPNWSRLYPGQEEILRYLTSVAEEYHLTNYIRFSTSVVEASWNENEAKWHVAVDVTNPKEAETKNEYILTTDYLISAVGQLNNPSTPNVPGLDEFEGKIMHTARWDWTYDYKGKKVAMVGNGASGIQVVPAIAADVKDVTVFQRTPSYIIFRGDTPVPRPIRGFMKICPPLLWALRSGMMDFRELLFGRVMHPAKGKTNLAARLANEVMKRQLPDKPEMWDALTPRYTFGCKRVLVSDDYYPSLSRENVHLVPHAVEKVTRTGVVSNGQEYEADMLVLATGFRSSDFMAGIKMFGKNGKSLREVWKKIPRALYGVAVEHMPNFAMLYGPNTNLGHNSIILMIEAQSRYLMPLIKEVLAARQRGETLAVLLKISRVEEYNEQLQREIAQTSMADPDCQSWYKNEDGTVINNWAGSAVAYQKLMSTVNWDDFELGGTAAATVSRKKKGKKVKVGYVHEDSISKWTGVAVYPLIGLALYQGLKWSNPDLLRKTQDLFQEALKMLPDHVLNVVSSVTGK